MNTISILSLAFALFILAATPGPGVFATISRSLASGFTASLGVITGIITGDIIFLLLAILGMSVIAQILGHLFIGIKIIGGLYLIYLGIKLWISPPAQFQNPNQKSKYSNYLSGLLITLSNPKVILFYCGFLPTFMDLSVLNSLDILLVAAVVTIVLSCVLILYAFLASQSRQLFFNKRHSTILNRTAGGIMVGTGVTIAFKS